MKTFLSKLTAYRPNRPELLDDDLDEAVGGAKCKITCTITCQCTAIDTKPCDPIAFKLD